MNEMYKRSGVKPPALHKKPRLEEQDLQYLQVFYELNHARQVGEVLGPILPNQMDSFFRMFGYESRSERERVFRMVRRLDEAYLTHHLKKSQQKVSTKPGSSLPGLPSGPRP